MTQQSIIRNADGIAILQGHVLKTHDVVSILVDDDTFLTYSKQKIYIRDGYPTMTIGQETKTLHRQIMDAKPGDIVDHRDRNKLNAQRINLRIVTHMLSAHNKVYGGVQKIGNCFSVQIMYDGIAYLCGRYANEDDAKRARDLKALEFYGDDATLSGVSLDGFSLRSVFGQTRLFWHETPRYISNVKNLSTFEGRGIIKRDHGFVAKIKKDGIMYHCGYYSSAKLARIARDLKAKELGFSESALSGEILDNFQLENDPTNFKRCYLTENTDLCLSSSADNEQIKEPMKNSDSHNSDDYFSAEEKEEE